MSTPADALPLPGASGTGTVDLEAEFLSSFGMPPAGTSEPPLSTDDPAGDRGAGAEKSDTGKDTTAPSRKAAAPDKGKTPAGDAKTGDDVGEGEGEEDLEALDDEDDEDRAIKAASPEHKPALERIRKAAKFEDHVRDATKPPKEIVDYLKGISAARYSAIAAEVVKERVGNTAEFIEKDLDDASYAKLATEIIKRDPSWVVKQITGRNGLKLSDIVEALDAKEAGNKDSVVELPELDAATMDELAEDYEEVADFLKAVKLARNGTLPKAFTSKLEAANAEVARLTAELAGNGKGKSGDRATKTPSADDDTETEDKASTEVHPDTPKIRLAVEADLDDYVTKQARHKDGLDLEVSDDERTAAPDVAELKDTKLEEWIFGSTAKKIPSFTNGLMTHFKDNGKFMSAAKQAAFYANKGEQANALAEAKNLRKFVDAYRKVRAELPQFKRLDGLIARAAKEAGRPAPHVEKRIPGGGSQTASPTSSKAVPGSDDDIVNGWGLGQE